MPEITAQMVKTLRESTNVSMMECKRALVESDGDMARATKLLRERGMAVAAKKATRAANQGLMASAASADGHTVSLVEVNCETDFVARNDGFQAFVKRMAIKACQTDTALADSCAGELTAKIAEIGENIVLRRNQRFVLSPPGRVDSYIHLGGKVGVLVDVGCGKAETASLDEFRSLVRDLTLHIAASRPRYLRREDVPAAEIASEREIYAQQVKDKPPRVIEKIVDGKLGKFFADVCLLEQPFVREVKQSITDLLAQKGKELGDTLCVRRFLDYRLGE